MNNYNIMPLIKEIVRLAIFSMPGALILLLTNDPSIAGAYGVPILYILRAIDKSIHEDKSNPSQGILPF